MSDGTRTKVSKVGGVFVAICPACFWTYASAELPKAHAEATHHTCTPVLGPRRLPPGTTIVGAGSMTPLLARDPRPDPTYWGYGMGRESRRPEVW